MYNNSKMNYKLCYVKRLDDERITMLWFSKLDVSMVCGDDWNDAPYECNAGEPYEDGNDYVRIIVEDLDYLHGRSIIVPCDEYLNSPYSVLDINNRKVVPWVIAEDDEKKVEFYAGASLERVINLLGAYNGIKIYS